MLKIKDTNNKLVAVLGDEDTEPQFLDKKKKSRKKEISIDETNPDSNESPDGKE